MLLVLEAGGMVSAPYPEQDMMRTGNIVAATPKIFPGMLEILREHPVRHFDDPT